MPDEQTTPPEIPQEVLWKNRKFQRVLISYIDFQQASAIAHIILSQRLHEKHPRPNRFLLQGLNAAMVVAYCRPFSGHPAKGGAAAPDLPEKYLRLLTAEELEIHNTAMADRNSALAHSDSEVWAMTPFYMRMSDGHKILFPSHAGVHEPLLHGPVEILARICVKFMDALMREREALEHELEPYLPVADAEETEEC